MTWYLYYQNWLRPVSWTVQNNYNNLVCSKIVKYLQLGSNICSMKLKGPVVKIINLKTAEKSTSTSLRVRAAPES